MTKSGENSDRVKKVLEWARNNKFLSALIILGIVIISVGGVFSNLDNIITFYRKYFIEESTQEKRNEHALPSAEDIAALGRRAAPWHNEYGGNKRSYRKLLYWRDKINDSIRRDLIVTEIERVEKSYPIDVMRINIDNQNVWGYICKPHVNCTQGYVKPTGFPANTVISHLGSNRDLWRERARAACILRNIKTSPDKDSVDKEDFYQRLVTLMDDKEPSLCVSKMALETYKDLTGFSTEKVFDFEGAKRHWEKNMDDILKINF